MPVSLLNADTMFPSFTEGTSSSEKIDVVMNYLYMLLEELRYTFGNLGTENFNDKSLDELAVTINKPVLVEIEDSTKGLLNKLQITAEGLEALTQSVAEDSEALAQFKTLVSDTYATIKSITNLKTEITEEVNGSVTQTVSDALAAFEQTVSETYAKISSLAEFKQEVKEEVNGSVTQTVSDALAAFEHTADETYAKATMFAAYKQEVNGTIDSFKDSVNGSITSITETMASFTADADSKYAKTEQIASITNSYGNVTAASIVAAVNTSGSSVKISADKVDISGFVTFSELADSSSITTINGAAISTGTLTASTYKMFLDGYGYSDGSVEFYYNQLSPKWKVGGICIDDNGAGTEFENTFRVRIFTQKPAAASAMKFSLKLESCGRLSIEAPEYVYVESGENITIRANSGRGIINLDGDVYIRGTSLDEILASL